MENQEEILDALNDFEKKPVKDVPPLLEQFLGQVATTGETLFPWPRLKPLFLTKLDSVMQTFNHEEPGDYLPKSPNAENVTFEEMRKRILGAVERFNGAPFTIQRLCELITEPKKHYKRSDKFLRGIEKNVQVVSTVDPFGRKSFTESKNLVNGLDVNGHTGLREDFASGFSHRTPWTTELTTDWPMVSQGDKEVEVSAENEVPEEKPMDSICDSPSMAVDKPTPATEGTSTTITDAVTSPTVSSPPGDVTGSDTSSENVAVSDSSPAGDACTIEGSPSEEVQKEDQDSSVEKARTEDNLLTSENSRDVPDSSTGTSVLEITAVTESQGNKQDACESCDDQSSVSRLDQSDSSSSKPDQTSDQPDSSSVPQDQVTTETEPPKQDYPGSSLSDLLTCPHSPVQENSPSPSQDQKLGDTDTKMPEEFPETSEGKTELSENADTIDKVCTRPDSAESSSATENPKEVCEKIEDNIPSDPVSGETLCLPAEKVIDSDKTSPSSPQEDTSTKECLNVSQCAEPPSDTSQVTTVEVSVEVSSASGEGESMELDCPVSQTDHSISSSVAEAESTQQVLVGEGQQAVSDKAEDCPAPDTSTEEPMDQD